MNFHIFREITHDNPGKPTYQLLGSTRFEDDALALLARWHSGYIVTTSGNIILEKNLTKKDD